MSSLFGFPIRSDGGTLSGGSWETALPLWHMQMRDPSKKARSDDATAASTKFDIDLGGAFPIRAIALFGHNLTLSATVRVYADESQDFASLDYDPGADNAYPTIYPDSSSLWGVNVSNSALTAQEYADGARLPYIHLPSASQTWQFWRVEITDTGNPDGYVEISRLVICQGWEPTNALATGARTAYETSTEARETDGGTFRFRPRPMRRRLSFTIPQAELDEALVQSLELLRRANLNEQVLFVTDLADTIHLHRRSMLATMSRPGTLEIPRAGDWTDSAIVLEEEVFPT